MVGDIEIRLIDNGVVAPKGFLTNGDFVGVKAFKKDLAIILSEKDCVYAGCFTKNVIKSAPVKWDMSIMEKGNTVRALVVISGNANSGTGEQGLIDNTLIAETLASCAGIEIDKVLICNTGTIGKLLPVEKIRNGIKNLFPSLSKTEKAAINAAQAILTTDTVEKAIGVEVIISGLPVRIGGMAKGASMIHPDIATMLSIITTDVNIERRLLIKALRESVLNSYDMISIDGDTSTNDSLIILANGVAGNMLIDNENEDYKIFADALNYINIELAKDIVRDAEGASKFIEVKVIGAKTLDDARKIARSVVSSNLFKIAMFGNDPNWGRVLCAVGYSGGIFEPDDITISLESGRKRITVFDNGNPIIFNKESAKKLLNNKDIYVNIVLKDGNENATAWGCDLTHECISINADHYFVNN